MSDFKTTWDSDLDKQKEIPVDLIASIKEEFINQFLEKHRSKDKIKYYHKIELPLYLNDNNEMKYFNSFINIGGKVKENGKPDNSNPVPFKIDFKNNNVITNPLVEYNFKEGLDYDNQNTPPSIFPNISLRCENIGILLKWPKQDGSGDEHKAMLNLYLDFKCKVDFIKNENRTSLKFLPTLVKVGASEDIPGDPIVQDLIIVLVNYIMKEQGPKFIREIEIPVIEMSKYKFLPNLIKIDDDLLSIYMNRDFESIQALTDDIDSHQKTFLKLIDEELSEETSIVKLMFGEKVNDDVLKCANDDEKLIILEKSEIKSFDEIFPKTKTFLNHFSKKDLTKKSFENSTKTNQNIGIAIVEDFLDTIVRDSMPGSKEKSTKTKKALDSIKGRIRTWVRLFNSDIEVSSDGKLKGSTQVDVGAMLEYKLREYYRCSTGWSKWKKVGLRVKGRPELSVKVIKSRKGVGIDMNVDLRDLELSTGLGKLIDALVNLLFKLFVYIINGILDILEAVLSFIVFPIEFELSQQKTKIKLSNIHQWRYNRNDLILRDNQKRYLSFLIKADAI
ncbi:MAG: hypothetical protein AB8B78_08105 [Polaribacter sp.]